MVGPVRILWRICIPSDPMISRTTSANRTITTDTWLGMESAAAAGELVAGESETNIFIVPGYRFKVVDVLLTNFHLPRSTLFMLVAAFSGLETMQRAYAHALRSGYRFYSYGDACLLDRAWVS